MDVFSLVKFWRNAGIGDPLTSTISDDITDDESSFFDLVFTTDHQCVDSTTINIISDFHTNHHHHHHQQGLSNMDGPDTKSMSMSKSKSNDTSCSSPHSMFFNKSKILPLDSSSTSSTRTKSSPKSPFRVLKLGFQSNIKKMKHESNNNNNNNIKEDVTISSLLTRDNSLRNNLLKSDKDHDHSQMSSKRFSKEVVYKYLNIIKPCKRVNDKVPFPTSSPATTTSIFSPRKYLGKSRSSSSSSSAAAKPVLLPALRRDDSALQQQDGIQSAILHCKKSYGSPSQGCQVLSRSGSAPSHGARICVDDEKRSSI